MKSTSFTFCLALISLFFISCSNESEKEKKLLEERIHRIENGLQSNLQIQYGDSIARSTYNIEDRMKELKIPGLSIAVMNNGKIEWAKGYGIADSTENRKVTTNTLFQSGSISKPVAATRALQLSEKGIVDLNANVNDYLTSWKLPDNEFTKEEKATLTGLMTHSAGLTVHGFPGYSRGDTIPSVVDILDGKGNTGPVRVFRKPGERWKYSGGGYTIMQLVITDIEQKEFSQIMQEEVLTPLKMTSSTYENPLPEKYHNIAASGYYSDGTMVKGNWHVYPEMAAAGLWSTPSDLVKWTHEIQQIATTKKDGLLKAETVDDMLTERRGNQGLGPYVLKHTFGHGGADEGFRADLRAWKEQPISVAIMTNSDNGSTIIQEIFLSIAEEYNLPDVNARIRKVKEQSPEKLKRYEGTYLFTGDSKAKVVVKENGLEFTGGPASGPIYLLPESDTKFFSSTSGLYFTFVFEQDQVTGLKVVQYEAKKLTEE